MSTVRYLNKPSEIFLGDQYFKRECLPDGYGWPNEKKLCSSFFQEKGFFVSMMYNEWYASLNGIESDRYVSMDLFYFFILPCLNKMEFCRAYADKNNYSILFQGIKQPETIIKNRNGIFYSAEEDIIPKEKAIAICLNTTSIIKPTIDTGEGRNVQRLNATSENSIRTVFDIYGKDFIVQQIMQQHAELARLNATSLNTMRILTYRTLAGDVVHMRDGTFLRIGSKGAVRDNMGSGGGACKVYDDGHCDDKLVKYKALNVASLRNDYGVSDFVVPNYGMAVELAKKLHLQLPYFDYIGWDIGVGPDGEPFFLEFNPPSEIGASQSVCGPVLQDWLDEIIGRVVPFRRNKSIISERIFPNGFVHSLKVG